MSLKKGCTYTLCTHLVHNPTLPVYVSSGVRLLHTHYVTNSSVYKPTLVFKTVSTYTASVGLCTRCVCKLTEWPDRPIHGVGMHEPCKAFCQHLARNRRPIELKVRRCLIPRPDTRNISGVETKLGVNEAHCIKLATDWQRESTSTELRLSYAAELPELGAQTCLLCPIPVRNGADAVFFGSCAHMHSSTHKP